MSRHRQSTSCVPPLLLLVLCSVTYGNVDEVHDLGARNLLEAMEFVKESMMGRFLVDLEEARSQMSLFVNQTLETSQESQARRGEQFAEKFVEATEEIKEKTEKVMNYSSYQLDLLAKEIERISERVQLRVLVARLKRPSLRPKEDESPKATPRPSSPSRADIPITEYDDVFDGPEVFLLNDTVSNNEAYLFNEVISWDSNDAYSWHSPKIDLRASSLKSSGQLVAAPEVFIDTEELAINSSEVEKEKKEEELQGEIEKEKVKELVVLRTKEKREGVGELSVWETKEKQKEEEEKSKAAPRDCSELLLQGKNLDGVYTIYPKGLRAVRVLCDQTTDGGGWTVLVARGDFQDHEDFARNWTSYEEGFGSPEGEYWIGNKMIHELTRGEPQMLRAEMEDWEGQTAWAQYSSFWVEGGRDLYRLHVDGYDPASTAGNGLEVHSDTDFSTQDRDNDHDFWMNCAEEYGGGWWYYRCFNVLGTGAYRVPQNTTTTVIPDTTNSTTPSVTNTTTLDTLEEEKVEEDKVEYGGVEWRPWRELGYSLKTFQLKIRPQTNEEVELDY